MRLLYLAMACLACLASSYPSQSGPGQAMNDLVTSSEKLLLGLAEAMPEEAYGFAPTNGEFRGVRTFIKQVKHAAAVQYLAAACVLGDIPPADAADERGPDSVRTKADAIKYLRDSYAYLR